jgi:hypothetical protein
MIISAGTILVLQWGEYSDHVSAEPLRVMRDFDQAEVVAAHSKQWTPADGLGIPQPDPDSFMRWLRSEGYVEPIEGVVSWHVGASDELYGDPNTPAQKYAPKLFGTEEAWKAL